MKRWGRALREFGFGAMPTEDRHVRRGQKVRFTAEDEVKVVTTAPSCGDSLSPQSELRLAAENGNVPAMYHYALECSDL